MKMLLTNVFCALFLIITCGCNLLHPQPIHLKIKEHDVNAVIKMLDEGADVESPSPWSEETPLMIAAENGDVAITQILLKKGADVDARSLHQNTPLHYAVSGGNLEVLRMILEENADVNARNMKNYTPLMWAASNNRQHIVKKLLEFGADPNLKNNHKDTALSISKRSETPEITQLLLDAGAK